MSELGDDLDETAHALAMVLVRQLAASAPSLSRRHVLMLAATLARKMAREIDALLEADPDAELERAEGRD